MLALFPVAFYFTCLSFLTSLFVYKNRSTPFYLKLFPPFLLTTIVIEILSTYLSRRGITNFKLYNFFTVFEFCFYLFIISRILISLRARKIITYTIFSYLVISLLNILFLQKHTFHSITYSLGCLLIVTASVYYFLELFQFPKSIRLTSEPSFWICSGLLFYYCCSFPFLGILSFISTIPEFFLNNVRAILIVINILLYSSFTIAFLCKIRIRKYILR